MTITSNRWPNTARVKQLRGESDGVGPMDRPRYGATGAGYTNDAVWKKLMRDWYGLRPVAGDGWMAYCPHRLIGKRCNGYNRYGGPPCVWMTLNRPVVWDHARAWRDRAGVMVITLEPYGSPRQLGELERDLSAMGVVSYFEGRSPYGASYILFLKRAGA